MRTASSSGEKNLPNFGSEELLQFAEGVGADLLLTANMGTGGHNVPLIRDRKGIRKLTPRECARLQGFPDSYRIPAGLPDSRLYKQFGNSVTTTVIARVAEHIRNALQCESNVIPFKPAARPDRPLRKAA